MSSKFMKDAFSNVVESWDDLMGTLSQMERDSEWLDQYRLGDLEVLPLSAQDVKDFSDPDVYADTQQGSNLAIRIPDGRIFCLRVQGVPSIHLRAGITGEAYSRLSSEIEARHLNDGLHEKSASERGCVIKVAGDKILAVHSENYNPYSVLDGFVDARNFFDTQYPDAKFQYGFVSHEMAQAALDLSAYNEECFKNVMDFFGATKVLPVLGISMGDAAKSCVSLYPQIFVKQQKGNIERLLEIPLGQEMCLRHRGKIPMAEAFQNNLSRLQAQFDEPLYKLRRMKKNEMSYPLDAFMNACDKIGITKRYAKATNGKAKEFEITCMDMENQGKELTAFDVYMAMCDIPNKIEKDEADALQQVKFKAKETLKRAIGLDWTDMDYKRM